MKQRKDLGYLSRYFGQGTTKKPFRSSSQAATCYYQSNHSKVEAIRQTGKQPLKARGTQISALPKDTTSELAGMLVYGLSRRGNQT